MKTKNRSVVLLTKKDVPNYYSDNKEIECKRNFHNRYGAYYRIGNEIITYEIWVRMGKSMRNIEERLRYDRMHGKIDVKNIIVNLQKC